MSKSLAALSQSQHIKNTEIMSVFYYIRITHK